MECNRLDYIFVQITGIKIIIAFFLIFHHKSYIKLSFKQTIIHYLLFIIILIGAAIFKVDLYSLSIAENFIIPFFSSGFDMAIKAGGDGGAIALIDIMGGGGIIRAYSSSLLSMYYFYLSFSTLRRDCTSRQEIMRVMRPTISRLAIEGVHVENHIVDAVHGINGGWLVAVTD